MFDRKKFRGVSPSTFEATENAIKAFDAFLERARSGSWFPETEADDDRDRRIALTRSMNYVRKRKRMMVAQDCRCYECAQKLIDENGHENTAYIDYFVLPIWGGPKHELNMALICFECAKTGRLRLDIDMVSQVGRAKNRVTAYLKQQAALNR